MTDAMLRSCELFVKNRNIMKENFKWDSSQMHPLCASLYSEKGLEIDAERIKECKNIIKRGTGFFSEFKGTAILALATMLSMETDPEGKFRQVTEAYGKLKLEFHSSPYLPLASFVMAEMTNSIEFERIISKAKSIYSSMKKDHPFLTSSEDSGFAVLFALSDLSKERAVTNIEECFSLLKGKFFSSNAVQSLSLALAIGDEPSNNKCDRALDIFNRLKERGCKYGTGVELATLGLLTLASDDVEKIVDEVVESDSYLKSVKGFGAFGTGRPQRLMYAGFLVANEYKKKGMGSVLNTSMISSITSMIIAEQVAVMAAITATAAGASASD